MRASSQSAPHAFVRAAAAFASDSADRFYPGDDQVDWVAADGYNGAGCRPQGAWRDLSDIFGDFVPQHDAFVVRRLRHGSGRKYDCKCRDGGGRFIDHDCLPS